MVYSSKNLWILASRLFSPEWGKWCLFTISIIWRKGVIHNLDLKMRDIKNKVNFWLTDYINHEEQTSKYQYALQLCRLNANLVFIFIATFKQLCAAWRKCLRKIWRVHPMTHCDVITLLSHCKPMEVGIQQRFCKFVANIFQNGTLMLRTIVLTVLNNPLSVFL